VERLLGHNPENESTRYGLPDAVVYVEYAKFSCGHVPPPGWNVPAGTVVALRVALKKRFPSPV